MRFACVFFVVVRVPPRSPLTDTLFPYTALVRSPPRKGGRFRLGAFAPRGQEGRPFSFGGLRPPGPGRAAVFLWGPSPPGRSEEHTSELQSLMRTSYAVFCLTTKNAANNTPHRAQQRSTTQQQYNNTTDPHT